MEEIANYIFSDKNISSLSQKMQQYVNIEDSSRARNACREFVKNQMNVTIKNNRNIRGNPRDVIKKLNTECLKRSVHVYKEKMGQDGRQSRSLDNMGKYSMNRETEIYGKRKNKVQRRPTQNMRDTQSGMPGTMDNIGTSFAPLADLQGNQGEFIGADGSRGRQMVFGNMNDALRYGDKKTSQSLIEQEMYRRKMEYDAAPNQFNGGGMNMDGGMDMYGGMQQGMQGGMPSWGLPNAGPQGRRPPDINFALDGSDSRNTGVNEMNIMGGGMDMNGMMNQQMMGGMNGMMNPQMMGGMNGMMNPQMMNPQMMNPQMMNPQMMNPQMNNSYSDTSKMSEQDMMARINQLQRSDMNGNNMGNMANMGMMNPQMMQNIYSDSGKMQQMQQNFLMGGREGGDYEMMAKINKLKASLAEQTGLDPQILASMNSHDIEQYLKQNKGGRKSKKSKQVESSDEESSESEEEKSQNKKNILKMLLDLKKKNSEKKKELDDHTEKKAKNINKKSQQKPQKKESSDEDSDSDKSPPKKSLSKKSQQKPQKKESSDEDSDEVSESESESDRSNDTETKTTTDIKIKSETHSEPEFYSDYLVELDKPINSEIYDITISKCKFPSLAPQITEMCNTFCVRFDDHQTDITLPEGNYSLSDLIDGLNESLEEANIVIKVDNKGRIVLERKRGEFVIDCGEKSIAKLLGFTKSSYEGRSKYISETQNMFEVKSIYMFIPTISGDEPFCKIDDDGVKQLFKLSDNLDTLKSFVVQFRRTSNSSETDLFDFQGRSHEFTLKITHKQPKRRVESRSR